MDNQKVIEKIKKLLAIAADDANFDGEITAAMSLAARAMDEHHLTMADIEAAAGPEQTTAEAPEHMSKAETAYRASTAVMWEGVLAMAIQKLVGTIGVCKSRVTEKSGSLFAVETKRAGLLWYGPAEDATLAAELFETWSNVIATIATGRYGGCIRGPGEPYARGFAQSLYEKAVAAEAERKTITTTATTALALRTGGTLAAVIAQKRQKAEQWLQDTTGWKLRKGSVSRARGFRSSAAADTYHQGRRDGSRAEFTATRTKKLAN